MWKNYCEEDLKGAVPKITLKCNEVIGCYSQKMTLVSMTCNKFKKELKKNIFLRNKK